MSSSLKVANQAVKKEEIVSNDNSSQTIQIKKNILTPQHT